MIYQQALNWLFSQRRGRLPRGPERAKNLLRLLNNPQKHFKAIHVIGTNGKGSVCAMLSAGLQASGLRVGRFTSPHLLDFCERIEINGKQIDQNSVINFVERAKNWPKATFFDLSTVLAFAYFAQNDVDIAVIEAGVGGKDDPTINLENVLATIITNVDFDHVATIGPTLADIAAEKAGAIRVNTPVITVATGESLQIIKKIAEKQQAKVYQLGSSPIFQLPKKPKLQGDHQIINASLATGALRLLGFAENAVDAALNTTWPGRFEVFQIDEQRIIIDGAHNPAAIAALLQNLKPGFVVIFAAKAKKDVEQMVDLLKTKASSIIFTSIGLGSADPEQLAQKYGEKFTTEPMEALVLSLKSNRTVLITGSLYLIGQLRNKIIGLKADQQ